MHVANRYRLGYRRIVQLLVYLVIIPTVLLLALGIVLLFLGEARLNVLLGLLTICFVCMLVTGAVLTLVFVKREANLSELQADFVSKVSHELRTPLTAIRLFAETLERCKGDDAMNAKCLSMLNTETERLSTRIERLLDWGRMEGGRKLYDLREESVTEIVESAISAFSPLRYTSDLVFSYKVEGDIPHVQADAHALVDAIVNLLSNAQKYGGSPPHVRLRVYLTSKSQVCIEVSDNGDGIPIVEQRRIFDKFYRIDDRLSRVREGSGLGLAIVQHVTKAHGGRITLESSKGEGSSFGIVLPALLSSSKERSTVALPAHDHLNPQKPSMEREAERLLQKLRERLRTESREQ